MEFLTRAQMKSLSGWIHQNARPTEKAKWDYLFGGGKKEYIVAEMLKYQNADGGFGNGFESDILLPQSAAIPSAEAIFTAYEYDLDCKAAWFVKLLGYFENTLQDTPSFWEAVPKEIEKYPHPPWWGYQPDTKFTPNPCAVIASAMILHGTPRQKEIGYRVALMCIDFLSSDKPCGDHECYCLQRLIAVLLKLNSPLINAQTLQAMKKRIGDCVCFDETKWTGYVAQPLDLADNPYSPWYDGVSHAVSSNFSYWLKTLHQDGYWPPNFSWGTDSDAARQATQNWIGYIAVKRARIFKNFNRIAIS